MEPTRNILWLALCVAALALLIRGALPDKEDAYLASPPEAIEFWKRVYETDTVAGSEPEPE